MESYELFYSRTLNSLLPAACSTSPRPQGALSHIRFYGRSLLEPVLSEDQRLQMADDRQTAVQRDRQRQTRQTDTLLQRVQLILNNISLKTEQNESISAVTPPSDSSPSLQPKSSSIRRSSAPDHIQTLSPSSRLRRETLRLLNQRLEKLPSDESSDGTGPESPESSLASLSISLTGSYACLPLPQPSRSPLAQRARGPRAHAAGNILISRPVSESELSAAGSERLGTDNEWNCSCSESGDGQLSIITSTPSSTSGQKHTSRFDETQDEKPRTTRRSPPAPLNRSYDVENPEPALIRPQVESGPSDRTVPHRSERETHSPQLLDDHARVKQEQTDAEQHIEALEAMRERLEREHAHQISELLAAQQRQTQHLQQELQRKLNEQNRKSLTSPAPDISWVQTAHMTTEHTSGTHTSHTQEECVDQMTSACRLTAVARGFLTRRLLQTDKITHLRKTIQDSREFIRSFQTDSQPKRVSVSHQDLLLRRRVTAQLRAALRDVHQIFFVWPMRDRLNLLQQDRERRQERTLRQTENDSPGNTRLLSLATQKTLERKIQRQVKKLRVIPKSSPVRILQPRLSLSAAACSQSAVKRDECLRARQKSLYRKFLSLG